VRRDDSELAPGGLAPEKPIVWCGSALDTVRAFPDAARQTAGRQLRKLQEKELPSDWKPMASVGRGVIEVRIHAESEYRLIVIANFDDAVYVLHAFDKKSRKTARHDIALARRRYQNALRDRRTR
jgi:phage-related protein